MINKLMRYKKPIVVIAGGYGTDKTVHSKHKIFSAMAKITVKYAAEVLAVSKFTQGETAKLFNTNKSKMVYNGIDLSVFKNYKLNAADPPIMLTVGNIFSMERYYIKGIDLFVQMAKNTPKKLFYVIGMNEEVRDKIKNIPSNCKFFPRATLNELVLWYNLATTYCQFSRYETFCLTLLEARACGCKIMCNSQCKVLKEINNINPKKLTIAKREKKLVEILDEYKK